MSSIRPPSARASLLSGIAVFWALAAIFGDELVGFLLIGPDANVLSLFQTWWWVYQGVILVTVGLAACLVCLLARAHASSDQPGGEQEGEQG